ncbi:carbohydrate kinase family protein [Chelatococcus sp. SYSU_G07232]|uniref:Carbohydrate kinase family protein n=1 Tax=Chelatococcus albus TaxID=3047466 RepID=A0ABT7AFC8_9HYPH|nr:carbohydrate kinase family protein [Chelatococcus sp. SYSU_G07232]MDJ1158076.1 carbohydrate kinase family protein [Chelatococcus sp. SYSU_G07232]
MAPAVLVVGNLILDTVVTLAEPLCRGRKYVASARSTFHGGQGANVAYTLAGLGIPVRFAGVAAGDAASRAAISALAAMGVDTSAVQIVDDAAPHEAVILHEAETGERTIVMHRDPRLVLAPALIDAAWTDTLRAVYLDGHEDHANARALALARADGVPVVVDVERGDAAYRQVTALADHIVGSRAAVQALAGKRGILAALRSLAGPGTLFACATDGAGAITFTGRGENGAFPVRPVRHPVDTTGAGDAFRAAYIAGLHRGLAPLGALRFAVEAGAAKCGHLGPRLPPETLRGLAGRLRELGAEA